MGWELDMVDIVGVCFDVLGVDQATIEGWIVEFAGNATSYRVGRRC
jgi:hypothetical protein